MLTSRSQSRYILNFIVKSIVYNRLLFYGHPIWCFRNYDVFFFKRKDLGESGYTYWTREKKTPDLQKRRFLSSLIKQEHTIDTFFCYKKKCYKYDKFLKWTSFTTYGFNEVDYYCIRIFLIFQFSAKQPGYSSNTNIPLKVKSCILVFPRKKVRYFKQNLSHINFFFLCERDIKVSFYNLFFFLYFFLKKKPPHFSHVMTYISLSLIFSSAGYSQTKEEKEGSKNLPLYITISPRKDGTTAKIKRINPKRNNSSSRTTLLPLKRKLKACSSSNFSAILPKFHAPLNQRRPSSLYSSNSFNTQSDITRSSNVLEKKNNMWFKI